MSFDPFVGYGTYFVLPDVFELKVIILCNIETNWIHERLREYVVSTLSLCIFTNHISRYQYQIYRSILFHFQNALRRMWLDTRIVRRVFKGLITGQPNDELHSYLGKKKKRGGTCNISHSCRRTRWPALMSLNRNKWFNDISTAQLAILPRINTQILVRHKQLPLYERYSLASREVFL